MEDTPTLEARLATLEAKVDALAQCIERDPSKTNWLENVLGTFEHEPDFAEVLRLGREYRQSVVDQNE